MSGAMKPMNRKQRTLVLLLIAGLLFVNAAKDPTAAESPEDFERRIIAELTRQKPEATAIFAQANEARAKKEHKLAAELYGRVYAMAPKFVHALRRQCGETIQFGDRAAALPLCRRAVEQEASAENMATLALSILTVGQDKTLSRAESTEALELASKAVDLKPDDLFMNIVLSRAAIAAESPMALRRGAQLLDRLAPDAFDTHIAKMILAINEGRAADAERSLERLRALGIDETEYQRGRELIRGARPVLPRILAVLGIAGGVWLSVCVLLLLAGWLLSQMALRAAARIPSGRGGEARGIDAVLRRIYRVVLWLCCVFYYISLPVVFLLVLGLGAGLLYAFIIAGHIPVKFALVIIILMFVTLAAIAKSVFVKGNNADPGRRLSLEGYPKLYFLLNDVAAEVGTPAVDSVYLTPGTEIAVMERGGMLRQFSGRTERCLILGVGVLEGMRLGPFKAILAHEYGHLSNRDTAGGNFALAVRRSLMTMAQNLAAAGAAAWYNPAWLFLNGFYRIFLRISQGASRLQEVLADRWAAMIFGAKAFETGLRHVIARSVRFEAVASATLKEIVDAKAALPNLYTYRPATAPSEERLSKP